MRWIALLALAACADPTPAPAPASTAPKSTAPMSAVGPAPKAAPATDAPDVDAKARFEARESKPLPKQLPKAWKALVATLDAKVLSARHLFFTRVDGEAPHREVDLVLRVFGDDTANDAKVRAMLKAWPDAKLEIDRVKGAPPRESQYTIAWDHTPPNPPDAKPCRTPKAVDLPPEAPKWLDRVTNARSTRRRVGAGIDVTAHGTTIELVMRYRNGYARDEAIGHFTKAATRQGYEKAGGDGLKQRWTHPDGRRLWWRPDNSRLHLGCAIAGPVLTLTLAPPR